jgi:hypothetical protein
VPEEVLAEAEDFLGVDIPIRTTVRPIVVHRNNVAALALS